MKLTDINKNSVKNISDKELISLHRRSHQLYILAKNKNNLKLLSFKKAINSLSLILLSKVNSVLL